MLELLRSAGADIATFLEQQLPGFSDDWWQRHVFVRLTYQQQRLATERSVTSLAQLDLAALLRVMDENWYQLSATLQWPKEGRNWIKELQNIRNKWAHISTENLSESEIYRDADTLIRLMQLIHARPQTIAAVDVIRRRALTAMTTADEHAIDNVEASLPSVASVESESRFSAGEIVALRADPSKHVAVVTFVRGQREDLYVVFDNGMKLTYYESQLQRVAEAGQEQPQLNATEFKACLTSQQILSPSTESLFSLRAGRIQFVPYQYRPVLKLIRSDRPRILIADEVGVGKTIEAGLIIKELQARMDLSSVLVICPKALVSERKWQSEMKRFDENFTPLDGPLLRHCLREVALDGEWPDQYAKTILPFSLFDSGLLLGNGGSGRDKGQGLLALDPPPKFDLVIVDEAHHIRNSETNLHQGIRYFCDNAQAVVLMTATPVQLGSGDLYTLLNVLRPDLIIDPASFQQMAEPNADINKAIHHCRSAEPDWQIQVRNSLEHVAHTQWGRVFIRETLEFQKIYDRLGQDGLNDIKRVQTIRDLERLYTFSPLINRTRRRDIGEFTTRKPETITVDFTPTQRALHDSLLHVVARILSHSHGQQNVGFMMTTIRRQAASCLYGLAPLLKDLLQGKLDKVELMEAVDSDSDLDLRFVDEIRSHIESVLAQAEILDEHDPKADAFISLLEDNSARKNNKALVFSTFRHTLSYLKGRTEETDLRVGLVHGDVPDAVRAELRRRFALPRTEEDALDVLLSSEVGCEGLDFQFCDFLVNYDLPWNPMRIEQRIGRIDRYGQTSQTIAIVNLITPDTVDADIYNRCLWRIGVFHHAVGGSEEILGRITQDLHALSDSFDLTAEERGVRFQQLADNGIRQIQEEQELESREAELFGLNVPRQSCKDEIESAESSWLSPAAIEICTKAYLSKRLGREKDHLLGEKPLKTLRISKDARSALLEDFKHLPRSAEPTARQWEKWLKGPDPTIAVTFDQETASANPNALHLTASHTLVRQAARSLEIHTPQYAVLAYKSADLPAGRHPFALYQWSKSGVRRDSAFVAVAANPTVEQALLDVLQDAIDDVDGALPSADEAEALDARHHVRWSEAQLGHMAENEQLVEHRIQSLSVSHQARCRAIEDQVNRATNDKIRLMKQSELTRAQSDFDRRLEELNRDASSGDIRFEQLVFGTLTIRN